MPAISFAESTSPFIVAIDLGTSSVRALIYDGLARQVEGLYAQHRYRMTVTSDGGVEIDPGRLVQVVAATLDGLHARAASLLSDNEIVGVGVTTFWHAMMGVDNSGRAVTPLYSWNDTRPREAARELRERLDERAVHERTGCMIHSSYWPAKLAWLGASQPETAAKIARWISIGDYLFYQLFGQTACSPSIASATGLFNQARCDWDDEMLAALNLSRENLPESRDLDAHFTQLKSDYDARWPLFSAAKWFAPLGDGACSNIGSGCVTRERAAINIGTSGALRVLWKQTDAVPVAPRGAWCYRADRSRLLIGGALSNGGDLIAWIRDTFKLGPLDDAEGLLAMMEPDAHGLTVLPFLSGERSTGWKDDARFVLAGATLDTTPSEVLRAGMEAVAYRFAAIHDVIARSVGAPGEIIASGAAANASRTWIQIIADALGRPVTWSGEREASSRGAALMVLEAMGLITDVETAAQVGDREPRTRFYPDEIRHARYQAARERQEKLYCAVLGAPSILLWSD